MNPDEKDLLDRTYRLTRENNKMLRAMRRNAFIGMIFRILFVALALGVPIWLYFNYLAPTMGSLLQIYGQQSGAGFNFEDIRALMEQFRGQGIE
jgi:hypothetical protein